MPTSYNEIAGKSIERIAALSDGLFAIAMTLLILELRPPAADVIHSEVELWHALVALSAQLIMYLIGFLTLGIFWIGQQSQLSQFAHADRDLTHREWTATRYDKLAGIYLAFIQLASIRLWLRVDESTP